jgi:hypothetical protein
MFANNLLAGDKSALSPAKLASGMENRKSDAAVTDVASKVTGMTRERPKYPRINTDIATEHKKSPNKPQEEDRENLKHFSSWGTPQPRNRPASRVRKIILSNLPPGSDLTLIQSLVYGGALESFDLSKPHQTSAWVIFVNADACDAFFNAHQRQGIVFKNPKTCRDHVVHVAKADLVDVVSSVMQAYLDCHASRVVRASGADEDWGMRALHKLAEAKNRKVEKIVDTYRDKVSFHTHTPSPDSHPFVSSAFAACCRYACSHCDCASAPPPAGPYHYLPLHQHRRCCHFPPNSHA